MTRPRDIWELLRAPAALTVLGDTVVGATSAGNAAGARTLPLAGASVCIYAAGMALNDYADAEIDALERPERPIPSGRVSRGAALGIGAALTGAGIGLAFTAGRAPGVLSLALAVTVWTYDLFAKSTPAGPAVMALCRGLDVLMGAAGPQWRRAALPASLLAAHTAGVTLLSRGEVAGSDRPTAIVTAATTTTVGTLVATRAPAPVPGFIAALGYATAALPAQVRAVREPAAAKARAATRQGIRAMIPLQIALVARTGSRAATAALIGVEAMSRLLAAARTSGDVT